MNFKLLLTAFFALTVSTVEAFTLKVNFPQGQPAQLDFAYALSTGNCSTANNVNCHFSKSSVNGIDGAHITEYLDALTKEFKTLTPVADKFNKPTNFIQMKVPGQKGVCTVSLLGKATVSISVNKNGTCT